jgi:tetratricopeptide (TPR) repeat protein
MRGVSDVCSWKRLKKCGRDNAALRATCSSETRAACAFRRLFVVGWNAQDELEYRTGLAELGENHGSPVLDSDLLEDIYIRWVSGEYRAAVRLALEIREKGLEPGANPNLRFEYYRADALASVNLIFPGEWGRALKEFAAASAQAQKNANYQNILWLRVHLAWLHLHALDFKGVIEICQSMLALQQDPALSAAHPAPLRRALILSGAASASLGDYARALECFSTVASEMARQTVPLDWYWRIPLAAGLTELWLAKGDRLRARLEAERFLDMALATAERTFQGLTWEANARVALANQDHARAADCIAKAVSTVQGFEMPLAAWRVHATAAHIDEKSANPESARARRDLSRATILQLACSLPEQEPLRNIFLSAPAVARVLSTESQSPSWNFGETPDTTLEGDRISVW